METVTFHMRVLADSVSTDHYIEGSFSAHFEITPKEQLAASGNPPISSLYFPVETHPSWDQFTSLPIQISETPQNLRTGAQLFLSKRDKAGSTISDDRNRALSASSMSDDPRAPLGTGGPTLPVWIEEDRDPDLIPYEELTKEGKLQFTGETPNIPVPQGSSVVQKTISLAPVAATTRGLLDWHNRDYPYGYEWTSQSGVWSGMNRLEVEDSGVEARKFVKLRLHLKALHPHSQKKPRAICKIANGLPKDAWIGLLSNRQFDAFFNLQAFLIDKWGQRWTIDEQLISNPHLTNYEKFLKVDDFDLIHHGNIVPDAMLNPNDIVEIQLHPHGLENLNHPIEIAFTVMRLR